MLASQSPRRHALLSAAGVAFEAFAPTLEDSDLARGQVHPRAWAAALAYVKAHSVVRRLVELMQERQGVMVLGADTMVVHAGALLGKVETPEAARDMLRRLRGGAHEVVTGVAIVDAFSGERRLLTDVAAVTVGTVRDEQIDEYVASGDWRGKAGAYNLDERVRAGWPLACRGDPGTVMGLPMQRLGPMLRDFARA